MRFFPTVLLVLLSAGATAAQNTDLFNYDRTRNWESGVDYGPRDWPEVECDDLDVCYGWPEKWHFGKGWRLRENECENCEPGHSCGSHHQSPIPLERQWGRRKQMGDEGRMNCGDNHWMKYEEGTCTWDHLVAENAITVERHALRISQPYIREDGREKLGCLTQGRGRIFSRLDMSGGFSQWWWLNHVEIHTPSEHTQNGKRFAAEVQMGHFYSVPRGEDNGSNNRMATIGIFLDADNTYAPYPYLDKLICQWRRSEHKVRTECGLAPIQTDYPGCGDNQPTADPTMAPSAKPTDSPTPVPTDAPSTAEPTDSPTPVPTEAPSPFSATNETAPATDRNGRRLRRPAHMAREEAVLHAGPENYREAEWTEEQWAAFQEEYSRRHPLNASKPFHNGRRHLMNYDHVDHLNYQFLLDCRTEYYFRYEGTQTYPPCFEESNNNRVNVWRFMKDPIRVNPRQIQELHRLLKERIAPRGSYDGSPRECKPDTAAKTMDDGTAWVARNMQELDESGPGSNGHDNYFCECSDWGSKVPEEREWCSKYRRDDDMRWFIDPYNGGFGDFSRETNVYAPPTPSDWRPTDPPTMQPTVFVGIVANFEKVGGDNDPPASALPLRICQGDCDDDDDCGENLVCWQRDPGDQPDFDYCAGETDGTTDYCVLDPGFLFGDNGAIVSRGGV